jgi:hypothetical protein
VSCSNRCRGAFIKKGYLEKEAALQRREKMVDILRGKIGKIGVYNSAYISLNKIWKNISF